MFDESCSIELHICLYLITAAWAKSSLWSWSLDMTIIFSVEFSSCSFVHPGQPFLFGHVQSQKYWKISFFFFSIVGIDSRDFFVLLFPEKWLLYPYQNDSIYLSCQSIRWEYVPVILSQERTEICWRFSHLEEYCKYCVTLMTINSIHYLDLIVKFSPFSCFILDKPSDCWHACWDIFLQAGNCQRIKASGLDIFLQAGRFHST